MGDDSFHKGYVRCIKQTDKAILCQVGDFSPDDPGHEEEFWVPQSQIHEDSEVWKEGDEGELVVSGWYARKEGWA
jgi:hypothetical protein